MQEERQVSDPSLLPKGPLHGCRLSVSASWALGYYIHYNPRLPAPVSSVVEIVFGAVLPRFEDDLGADGFMFEILAFILTLSIFGR